MTPFEIVATLSATTLVGIGALSAFRMQKQVAELRPRDDRRVQELLSDKPNGHNSKLLMD